MEEEDETGKWGLRGSVSIASLQSGGLSDPPVTAARRQGRRTR
eukprot:COSAG02_NODE_77150_length_128_cov_22.965517_1_plen_42_part_11